MTTDQLFPKPRRRMKQPRKDELRHVIRCRDAEIYRLRAEIAMLRRPWWRRLAAAFGFRPSGGFSGHGDSRMRADKR